MSNFGNYNELKDSEYEKTFGTGNNKIPTVYAKEALKTYSNYERANKLKIFNSAIGVDLGGIGVAISKMAIASKKGLIINLLDQKIFNMNPAIIFFILAF